MFLTIIITLVCVYLGYVIVCRQFLPRINEQVPTFPGRLPLIGHTHMMLKNENENFWPDGVLFRRFVDFSKPKVKDKEEKDTNTGYCSYKKEFESLRFLGDLGVSRVISFASAAIETAALVQSMISYGEYALKVGGVTKFFMGPMPVYVVTDPVDVVTVLNKCLKKMFVYRLVEPLLGKMLISAEVPIWKRNRRILDLCFKQQLMDENLKLFNDRAGKFVALIAEDAGKGEVDLTDKITSSVLETTCRTTLGARVDGKDLVDNNFMVATNELLEITVTRINKPWLLLDFVFNLSSYKKRLDKALAMFSGFSKQMVELRKSEHLRRLKNKEDINDEDGHFRSVLDVFIENSVTETSSILTDAELRNLMDNVLVGAFDTTINEMLYSLICIGSYPEVQEKIYQEVTQVLGEDGRVTKQNISQLVYLEAAIKESLRLYPAGGIVGREATEDTNLRNVTIPAGSSVLVHIWCVNRNPEYWGADAEEFKPERWLNPDTAPSHKAAFATFSPGLRGCIGKMYAIMYLKATMAPILRRFKLTADHTKMKLMCYIFLKPVAGHLVRVEERRPNK